MLEAFLGGVFLAMEFLGPVLLLALVWGSKDGSNAS
jgi:hypothetical protein